MLDLRFDTHMCNAMGSGIRDPQFEITRIEIMRSDLTAVFLLSFRNAQSRVWTNLKWVGGPWRS